MKRIVLYLVVLGVLLYLAKAVAPLAILGVIGLVLLAWKRPESVGRFTDRPAMSRIPERMRATPMRFAGSVGFSAFALIGAHDADRRLQRRCRAIRDTEAGRRGAPDRRADSNADASADCITDTSAHAITDPKADS